MKKAQAGEAKHGAEEVTRGACLGAGEEAPSPDEFVVNVVFRGLFLAQPTDHGLVLLLPDGRRPQNLADEFRRVGQYREHHGVLEFSLNDWRNPTDALPRLLHLRKAVERNPTAFCLLAPEAEDVTGLLRFSSLVGGPFSDAPPTYADPGKYTRKGGVRIVVDDDYFGFEQLPRFSGEPVDDAWRASVGCCLFDFGEARSERRSPVSWRLVTVNQVELDGGDDVKPREINLDFRMRFSLPRIDSLVVELIKVPRNLPSRDQLPIFPEDPRSATAESYPFILHPADGRELTIYVKNLELARALYEANQVGSLSVLGQEYSEIDRDHGLLLQLARGDQHDGLLIPKKVNPGHSDVGSGCGGQGGS